MKKQYTETDPFTTKDLYDLDPDTVFAKGEMEDSPDGLHMTGSGQPLRWMAKTGAADDWCIYCSHRDASDLHLLRLGQKVADKNNIRKCVPCTDDVLSRYRY